MKKTDKTNPDVKVEVPQPKSTLLLPPNLAALTKLASKDFGKYSMVGVQLKSTLAGYQATATDGKFLGMVEGVGDDPDLYPELPAIKGAAGGATEALIPSDAWVEAFKMVPKATITKAKPILGNAIVKLAKNDVTFAATDMDKARSIMTRHIEGRFPNAEEAVKPSTRPLAVVRVNAKRLRDLLAVAEEYASDDENGVDVEIYGASRPMFVRTAKADQKFTGLLMPLTADEEPEANRLSAEARNLLALCQEVAGFDLEKCIEVYGMDGALKQMAEWKRLIGCAVDRVNGKKPGK